MENSNEAKHQNDDTKKSKKFVKKISLEADLFSHFMPKIVFKGPLRYVLPYPHIYKSFVKQRWENRTIVDIFSKEFRADSTEYYKKAIETGKIRVNGHEIDVDYKLRMNDMVEHETTRKEPPVYNLPIEFVFEDDSLIVINKPPSIPVHVCGHHAFNTIMGILRTDFNYKDVYFLHRLDKLTSGLLLIAKNADLASKFSQELKDKKVSKTYLARVHGKLLTKDEPDQELTVDKPIFCVSKRDAKYDVCKDEEKKTKNGKDAKTVFKTLWYDPKSDTTLLECRPITGKTHQIRIHLKSLGHSIVNDTPYGGKFVGNLITKYLNLDPKVSEKEAEEDETGEKIKKKLKTEEKSPKTELKKEEIKEIDKKEQENLECKNFSENKENDEKPKEEISSLESDLSSHVLEIWLHSFKYRFHEHTFSTKMPYWAVEKTIEFDIKNQ